MSRRTLLNPQVGAQDLAVETTSRTNADAAKVNLSTRRLVTANYPAANGDLVSCDTTGGTFTVTIPAASGGKARIEVKWVAGTVAPTINLSGSDKFNISTGLATASPTLLNQGFVFDSDGTSIWTVTSDDLPLGQLDGRYLTKLAVFPAANYASVNAAIAAANAAGGGTVLLPAGPTYVDTGGLHLLSSVTLAGPECRHNDNAFTAVDGSGYYRPFGLNPATGLMTSDCAYLVPTAGSVGPMVWATEFDSSYSVKNLIIFGVDVYGQNISPPAKPSWTNAVSWIDTNATTNSTTTLQLANVPAVPQMIGKAITGTGIQGGTTITAVNSASDQVTLSLPATTSASGVTVTVAGGFSTQPVGIAGRQAISFGSGTQHARARGKIENVLTWGCGSGAGVVSNSRNYSETNGTASGNNVISLSTLRANPQMVSLAITGPGVPANTIVVACDPLNNQLALSNNVTAGSGLTFTITGTSLLQAVYTGTSAVYLGQAEAVVRGISCLLGGGDGLVIDVQDCQIDSDNIFGFNNGWGLRTTINSGPIRGVGGLDSFYNGFYVSGGAGGVLLEGNGHRFVTIQANDNAQENLKFGRCLNTVVNNFNGNDAGTYFANNGIRYNDITFAAPAASASNPIWNTGANTGCAIIGGTVSTAYGWENYLVGSNENTAGLPLIIGLATAGTVWNAGAPTAGAFAWVKSFLSNFRTLGCPSIPDGLRQAGGVGANVNADGSHDALDIYRNSAVVASIGKNGAFNMPFKTQILAANGAVTIDASMGNTQLVTLQANATSSFITNAVSGQVLTVRWAQDATGSRTYAWPANWVFANGTTPTASTAPSAADTVTAWYDGTNWNEIARAMGNTSVATHAATHGAAGSDPVTLALSQVPSLAVQTFNASSTYTVPANVSWLEIICVGGGCGGGGGGSDALTSGVGTQVGGPGGAAGGYVRKLVAVTPATVLTVTVGAGSSGTAGGVASSDTSGHASTAPLPGGSTSVTGTGVNVVALGGGAGNASGAKTASSANGGIAGFGGSWGVQGASPGAGGAALSAGGQPGGGPQDAAGGGGGAGGPANATNGGGAGASGTAVAGGSNGAAHASGTSTGGNGTSASANTGSGGGGGGAGAPGGAGGNGGDGGSGFVQIRPIA